MPPSRPLKPLDDTAYTHPAAFPPEMDLPDTAQQAPSESCAPAPYGRACAGCARAKCKCFYRNDGTGCERCHRLGKPCEQSISIRKRRTKKNPSRSAPARNALEEKLDDIVTLLRTQAMEKTSTETFRTDSQDTTPSTLSRPGDSEGSIFSSPIKEPHVVLDTTHSVVHLLRPQNQQSGSPEDSSVLSPIAEDVSVHNIPGKEAEEQLYIFRRAFISIFPFVNLPVTMSASDLQREKPFLWLVIMALTAKDVTKQFEMAETFWKIVSRRVMAEHHASLDIILAILAFSSWSHYFKIERPFMNKLTLLAISLGYDLDLHKSVAPNPSRNARSTRVSVSQLPPTTLRTLEERRTFVALYQLSSTGWAAYRKTPPMAWTPYLSECVRILSAGTETHHDIVLATQVRCQLMTNQLTCPTGGDIFGTETSGTPSRMLHGAFQRELDLVRQGLPESVRTNRITLLYLISTELRIKDSLFNSSVSQPQPNDARVQRIQDLEATLTCAEHFLAVFSDLLLIDWRGINVDSFTQFTHCLIVLFKLTTLKEPDWDTQEVRRRADVLQILDDYAEKASRVPDVAGIRDDDGLRRGIFTKTPGLLMTIKVLMMTEMSPAPISIEEPNPGQGLEGDMLTGFLNDTEVSSDFIESLRHEPWLTDMMEYSWDLV